MPLCSPRHLRVVSTESTERRSQLHIFDRACFARPRRCRCRARRRAERDTIARGAPSAVRGNAAAVWRRGGRRLLAVASTGARWPTAVAVRAVCSRGGPIARCDHSACRQTAPGCRAAPPYCTTHPGAWRRAPGPIGTAPGASDAHPTYSYRRLPPRGQLATARPALCVQLPLQTCNRGWPPAPAHHAGGFAKCAAARNGGAAEGSGDRQRAQPQAQASTTTTPRPPAKPQLSKPAADREVWSGLAQTPQRSTPSVLPAPAGSTGLFVTTMHGCVCAPPWPPPPAPRLAVYPNPACLRAGEGPPPLAAAAADAGAARRRVAARGPTVARTLRRTRAGVGLPQGRLPRGRAGCGARRAGRVPGAPRALPIRSRTAAPPSGSGACLRRATASARRYVRGPCGGQVGLRVEFGEVVRLVGALPASPGIPPQAQSSARLYLSRAHAPLAAQAATSAWGRGSPPRPSP